MDLLGILLLGLLGSAHCVGMCGGFVLAISQQRAGTGRIQVYQALYFAGKTVTYAVLGASAGGFGHALGDLFGGLQQVLSILLGLFLLGVGLGLLGVLRRFAGPRFVTRGLGSLAARLGRLLQRRSPAATFGLGLVNGVLPCGLVYAALAVATATGSPLRGALAMAVFGAATIPALFALGLAGTLLRPAWRTRINQVSGVVVILLGLITMLRGSPVMERMMGHGGHEMHETMDPADAPHDGHSP